VARALSPARVWLHAVPYRESRRGMWLAGLIAAAHLMPSVIRGQECVCHCRGHVAGLIGLRASKILPRCRIVFDIRGNTWAEQPGSADDARLRSDVARLVESSCGIICVSESMRRQVVAQYPDAADKIRVIPCAASATLFTYDPETRREVRRRLRLDDRTVLAYCGGLAESWQVADRLMAAFAELRATRPLLHLLVVTPDVDLARRLGADALIDGGDLTVVSALHSEVPGYLMAADVGLLLRSRDAVNSVASPTKLTEYLMTGLPVAASEGVGDSDALFSSGEFGALIGDIADATAIDAAVSAAVSLPASDESRAARAARAAGMLSSDRYLPVRLELYRACKR
jgi:glycosyltransferase involved in cell wall biosynthesis